MMDKEIIHIIWDGPYRFEEVNKVNNDEFDYGIYQIYGPHPVYGSDVLLFIGKTTDELPFELTFGDTILMEIWGGNIDRKLLKFYVGRLSGESTPNDSEWLKQISLAEMLLIEAHTPALNKEYIALLVYRDCKDIHILNWGSYNQLLPEVSGLKWAGGTEIGGLLAPPVYKKSNKRGLKLV
jgi:hypothetical protein